MEQRWGRREATNPSLAPSTSQTLTTRRASGGTRADDVAANNATRTSPLERRRRAGSDGGGTKTRATLVGSPSESGGRVA